MLTWPRRANPTEQDGSVFSTSALSSLTTAALRVFVDPRKWKYSSPSPCTKLCGQENCRNQWLMVPWRSVSDASRRFPKKWQRKSLYLPPPGKACQHRAVSFFPFDWLVDSDQLCSPRGLGISFWKQVAHFLQRLSCWGGAGVGMNKDERALFLLLRGLVGDTPAGFKKRGRPQCCFQTLCLLLSMEDHSTRQDRKERETQPMLFQKKESQRLWAQGWSGSIGPAVLWPWMCSLMISGIRILKMIVMNKLSLLFGYLSWFQFFK